MNSDKKTEPIPLLFINSVSSKAEPHNQEFFDSRTANTKVKVHNEQFFLKLKRITQKSQKGRPIICQLSLTDKSELIVIPYEYNDKVLFCKQLDTKDSDINTAKNIEVLIKVIDDLSIIQL